MSSQLPWNAPMDAYEHFGLSKPPFDPPPDAEFFYDAPAHAEALATLQYTLFARKGCVVVVGESGYGKTLLARMAAASAAGSAPILWLDARRQSDNATTVSFHPPGRFGRKARGPAVIETTLGAQTCAARSRADPPVLVVDSADELSARGWRDVIAWSSDELRSSRPLSVLLFGLPCLLEMLAAPELGRLQWRIFRVCRLEPLSAEQTEAYIRARVATAGGDADRIFGDATLAEIGWLGQGNPARVNQLCDNALLEAYGDGRDRVAPVDVDNAWQAVFAGCWSEYVVLPAPRYPHSPALGAPPVAEASLAWPLALPADDPVEAWLEQLETRLSQALRVARETLDDQTVVGRGLPTVSGSRWAVAEHRRLLARPVAVQADSEAVSSAAAQPIA